MGMISFFVFLIAFVLLSIACLMKEGTARTVLLIICIAVGGIAAIVWIVEAIVTSGIITINI